MPFTDDPLGPRATERVRFAVRFRYGITDDLAAALAAVACRYDLTPAEKLARVGREHHAALRCAIQEYELEMAALGQLVRR